MHCRLFQGHQVPRPKVFLTASPLRATQAAQQTKRSAPPAPPGPLPEYLSRPAASPRAGRHHYFPSPPRLQPPRCRNDVGKTSDARSGLSRTFPDAPPTPPRASPGQCPGAPPGALPGAPRVCRPRRPDSPEPPGHPQNIQKTPQKRPKNVNKMRKKRQAHGLAFF